LVINLRFPEDFVWGAAASAYQIEGAYNEDGRGESIWDHFCHAPGNVVGNDSGDVACDHYHRLQEDIALMTSLNLQAYRFSVSWPRVLPKGRGQVNQMGLDFYSHLVDGLLEAGIEPFLTLYHWDLPQILQENGGWAHRDTVDCFEEYASVVFRALGDRVRYWITHNEPWVVAFGGHQLGKLAPGIMDLETAIQVAHHLLLSHGRAVDVLKSLGDARMTAGISLNLSPAHAATKKPEDQEAAARTDGYINRWFLDPLFKGAYPEDMLNLYADKAPRIETGDMKCISTRIDFLGVNYYSRVVMEAARDDDFIGTRGVVVESSSHTESDWEVYPQGLYEILIRLWDEYRPSAIYITENGAAFLDDIDENGKINDHQRKQFLQDHFIQAHRAVVEGVPLRGYFVWSLMDVFEWDSGYSKRFGLIGVNRQTLERTIKQSGLWFQQFIRQQLAISEVL
jgi:beta-glucosidase